MKNDSKKKVKNPAFRNEGLYQSSSTPVTRGGVVTKTMMLLFVVIASAMVTGVMLWDNFAEGSKGNMMTMAIVAIVLTLVLALTIIFKPKLAKPLGFIYAVVEGYLLGVISMAAMQIDGGHVVPTALFVTLAIVLATNVLYTTGIVKVNEKFMSIIFMMTAGAFFFYLFIFIAGFFGLDKSFLFDGSPLAIGIGLLMLIIASLNLFADYYLIDQFVREKADKEYEWYLAFGVVLTVVWIYIEVLRLVQNLTGND